MHIINAQEHENAGVTKRRRANADDSLTHKLKKMDQVTLASELEGSSALLDFFVPYILHFP